MYYSDIEKLPLTSEDILWAIREARQYDFKDNLRHRHPLVAFDSRVRGYVGERAMANWFKENNLDVRQIEMQPEDRMNIDLSLGDINIEVKTSMIPDRDHDLRHVFYSRDIKIIKRHGDLEKLKGDVHIQVYFEHRTAKKEKWLKARNIDLTTANDSEIYDELGGMYYIHRTYFMGWIDKSLLTKRLKSQPEKNRTWSYAKRTYWICPLKNCLPATILPAFLKGK